MGVSEWFMVRPHYEGATFDKVSSLPDGYVFREKLSPKEAVACLGGL